MTQHQWTVRPRCRVFSLLCLMALLGQVKLAQASGKADPLLELAPPRSSITVALEDWNAQSKAIVESRLYRSLRDLPPVRRWLDSDDVVNARTSVATIEKVFGVEFKSIVQSLLGEAAVLSLTVPEEGGPASPQGLLLVRFSDRPLLERLIDRLNTAQRDAGELVEVRELRHKGGVYWVRSFRQGTKSAEWYAILSENRFAWSNSEETIQGVVERQSQGKGLASEERFKAVRARLPVNAVLSLFVDPALVETLLSAAPRSSKPEEVRFLSLITDYLKALKFAGGSLAWNDGPVLHVEQLVDPGKLVPELKSWSQLKPKAEGGSPSPLPATAFAMADASIDLASIVSLFEKINRDDPSERLKNLWLALDGIFLGMNARTEVLPRLGPGVFGYLELPEIGQGGACRWPATIVFDLAGNDSGKLASAIVNGLRTLLAFTALDDKRQAEHLRVETKTVDGAAVTFLAPASRIAFGAHRDKLVIGTSPEGVLRFFAAKQGSGARFDLLRTTLMKEAGSLACIDLKTLHAFAERQRTGLAKEFASRGHRQEVDVARDIDQLLLLIAPFEAAYLTSRIDPGFTGVHHTLGFLGAISSTP